MSVQLGYISDVIQNLLCTGYGEVSALPCMHVNWSTAARPYPVVRLHIQEQRWNHGDSLLPGDGACLVLSYHQLVHLRSACCAG